MVNFFKVVSNIQGKISILNNVNSSFKIDLNGFVRCYATHWDPKFKKLRKEKFIKRELPDFDKLRNQNSDTETSEQRRSRLIKEGIAPPISFEYKPINITSSNELFDAYVPPEGDGVASIFSKNFASQVTEKYSKLVANKLKHARVVKKHDESFEESLFPEIAKEIYVNAFEALTKRDNDKLIEYVTENAYSKMWTNMKFKTIRWKWIESLEEPVVRHIITREMLSKTNIYAQVTVRFHTKQILAVYDRFGRLAFGDDKLERDILEYVVFEKHLTNPYGSWRMHDKIEPSWAPPKLPVIRTYRQPKLFKVDESIEDIDKSKFKKDDSHIEDEKTKLPAS